MSMDRRGLKLLEVLSRITSSDVPAAKREQALRHIDWDPALRNTNRWHDRIIAALRIEGRPARKKELEKLEQEMETLKKTTPKAETLLKRILDTGKADSDLDKTIGDFLVSTFVPTVHQDHEGADRCEQTRRNVLVAFALASHQRDNGAYPKQLSELAPKYLAEVPNDLFSGKALIYRPAEKGYILYSVGVNGKDEGGRWDDDDPPGDDLRVRIPLPEWKRRN